MIRIFGQSLPRARIKIELCLYSIYRKISSTVDSHKCFNESVGRDYVMERPLMEISCNPNDIISSPASLTSKASFPRDDISLTLDEKVRNLILLKRYRDVLRLWSRMKNEKIPNISASTVEAFLHSAWNLRAPKELIAICNHAFELGISPSEFQLSIVMKACASVSVGEQGWMKVKLKMN